MSPRIGLARRLGNRRDNQDRVALEQRGDTFLLVLADGLGGLPRGELAAEIAVSTLTRRFVDSPLPIASPADFLRHGLDEAHRAIIHASERTGVTVIPRTTCVTCLIQAGRAWWAHVGDSRFYLIRDRSPVARTRDHSRVERLLQQGLIGEQDALHHPEINLLTQSLGGDPAPPVPDQDEAGLEQGDTLLLCSDGLWNALHEREMVSLLSQHPASEAVQLLADAAEAASYPRSDNITLLAMNWPLPAIEADDLDTAIRQVREALNEYGDEMGDAR